MKKISFLVLMLMMLASCGNPYSYDRDYYIRVTDLAIPYTVDVKESFDDADGHTCVLFSVTTDELKAFLSNKKFKPTVGDKFWKRNLPATVGRSYFKHHQFPEKEADNLIYLYGSMGRTQSDRVAWLCLVDTEKNLVWLSILYPGMTDG